MNGIQVRFRPQLESLDGRALPSVLAGWEGMAVGAGGVHRGADSPTPQRGRGTTEEIPQGGRRAGEEVPAGVVMTINRNAGEEISI